VMCFPIHLTGLVRHFYVNHAYFGPKADFYKFIVL